MSYLCTNLISLASCLYSVDVQPLSREISRPENCDLGIMRQISVVVIFWVLLGSRYSSILSQLAFIKSRWDKHYKPQLWRRKLRPRDVYLPASVPTTIDDLKSQLFVDLTSLAYSRTLPPIFPSVFYSTVCFLLDYSYQHINMQLIFPLNKIQTHKQKDAFLDFWIGDLTSYLPSAAKFYERVN